MNRSGGLDVASRPIVLLTLAYASGVAGGNLLRPAPWQPLALGLGCLVLTCWAGKSGRGAGGWSRTLWPAVLGAAFFAGAVLSAAAWVRLDLAPQPARWAVVEGSAVSEARATESGYRFLLRATRTGRYWRAGETIYVTVRATEDATVGVAGGAAADGSEAAAPGDLVTVRGFLARPRPPGNPGEFDFPRYLASAGVRYTLTAEGVPAVRPPPGLSAARAVGAACRGVRDRLVSGIDAGLPADEAALLGGLLFGDTSRLPEDVARDFRRSGVYHILAVSGSNVAFIAGGFWLVSRPLLRLGGYRGSRSERVLWPATALVLVAYAVMSGLGPSVVRATLMAEAGLLYLWLGRRQDLWAPLCLTILVMLSARPLIILDVGFQLSFAATLGILVVYPPLWRSVRARFRGVVTTLAQAGAVSLAAQAGVLPLLAVHFGEVSVVGLVANIIVVPLSGVALTVGLAAGAADLAGGLGHLLSLPLFAVTSLLLKVLTGTARLFAGVPGASVITGSPPVGLVVLYYLAVAWVVRGAAVGKARLRLTAVVAAGLALSVGTLAVGTVGLVAGHRTMEVTFLDVGQGDSIYVRLPGGQSLLIDGGPVGAGRRVLGPFLRHRGIRRLDVVFVTHLHDDHTGGLAELLADPGISVGEVVVGPGSAGSPGSAVAALLEAASRRRIPIREAAAGLRLVSPDGQVRLEVLGPAVATGAGPPEPPGAPLTSSSRENNASLTLLVTSAATAFLFPGDLETTGEGPLIAWLSARLPRTARLILKVAHHGSSFATSATFLAVAHPEVAVVSVGRNAFGHPSPDTLGRLRLVGAEVRLTQSDGAITATLRDGVLRLSGYLSGDPSDPGAAATGQVRTETRRTLVSREGRFR